MIVSKVCMCMYECMHVLYVDMNVYMHCSRLCAFDYIQVMYSMSKSIYVCVCIFHVSHL